MSLESIAPDARHGLPALREILTRPHGEQVAAVRELRASLPPGAEHEAWNTRFGPGSLFEAWTRGPLTAPLYEANAATLRQHLATPDWTVVEVGGGDGRLWERTLRPHDRGRLVVVDPAEEPAALIRAVAPPGVRVDAIHEPVPAAALPEADAIVCSLTLHHVAGEDAAQRAAHGLAGPGKLEALRAFADALRPRDGLLILNEADIYCDLALPPGDPYLADRIVDSYVRRCARALIHAIDHEEASDDLRARWWTIARRWCLDQLDVVDAAVADRDVYELDVPRWLELLERAGLEVRGHGFTDRWGLFHRYLATPAS